MVEARGSMLIGNQWVTYIRSIPNEEWILLSNDHGWEAVYTGHEARDLIDELLEKIKNNPQRGTRPPERVAWVRVTEVTPQ